jgi:hypothetical protein
MKDNFETLEKDEGYNAKFKSVCWFLDEKQITNLRWLINRAYKTGYANAIQDNENDN